MLVEANKSSNPVFRIEDLTKIYRTGEVEIRALNGVNMQLFEGEMAALLGPSGIGKSTLHHIISDLDEATSGKVWFKDQELSNFKQSQLTRDRRNHVGFVFLVLQPHSNLALTGVNLRI